MDRKSIEGLLLQHWVHSHEEDTDREMVFRPATFNFPRSRGRRSFELKGDSTLIETAITPTDRREQIRGTWKLQDDNRLAFFQESRLQPSQLMQIDAVEADRLVIKKDNT